MPSGPTIRSDIERASARRRRCRSALPTATLHEAGGRIGVMPSAIKPVSPTFRVCGPAVTVHSPGGDNLWLHRAIYVAQPGDVLVVHVSGEYDFGYWGEIMSCAAKARGLAGLVIDGCVRDGGILADFGLPVFARGLCIRGTGKDYRRARLDQLSDAVRRPHGQRRRPDRRRHRRRRRDSARARRAKSSRRPNSARPRKPRSCERMRAGERTLEVYNF